MIIFFRRPKKLSDFETEVIQRLDLIELAQARSRQDFRQILREEIGRAINEHARKGWRQIS
jgi:hypothetical protein